jgi:hypothetical protein
LACIHADHRNPLLSSQEEAAIASAHLAAREEAEAKAVLQLAQERAAQAEAVR